MHFTHPLLCLAMATMTHALVLAPSPLEPRSIGGACSTPDGAGTCQLTSDCTTQGFNLAGYCPNDATNVQCCVKKTCSTSSGSGICMNTADSCGGSFVFGACPGDSTIKCCVGGGAAPPPPPPTGGTGSAVVSAAVKEEGLPYVWGGGGCAGPSGGGFDCSGDFPSPDLPLLLSGSNLFPSRTHPIFCLPSRRENYSAHGTNPIFLLHG